MTKWTTLSHARMRIVHVLSCFVIIYVWRLGVASGSAHALLPSGRRSKCLAARARHLHFLFLRGKRVLTLMISSYEKKTKRYFYEKIWWNEIISQKKGRDKLNKTVRETLKFDTKCMSLNKYITKNRNT